MKYLDEEEFFATFQPLVNAYFPKAPYQGCLFNPMNLPQISGFVRTHQIWTVQKIETPISPETNEVKISYVAIPGLNPLINTIGYFVTKESTKGNSERITVLLSNP